MITVAVMQPYLFPYLGYFQLIHAADRFVVLDDVAFIQRGWINRNRLLVQGRPHYFTVPLAGASQNRRICDISISDQPWKRRMLDTFAQAYSRAPHRAETLALIEGVVSNAGGTIEGLALASVRAVCEFLDLSTTLVPTARVYGNEGLTGQERILDICAREGAGRYVNAPGGRALYSEQDFAARGISLRFLRTFDCPYEQGGLPHQPNLSILDVLMFAGRARTREFLRRYELLPAAGGDSRIAEALP